LILSIYVHDFHRHEGSRQVSTAAVFEPDYYSGYPEEHSVFGDLLPDVPPIKTFVSSDRHASVTPEELCQKWSIGLKQARNTLKSTTQHGVRSSVLPISWRYGADRYYNKKRLRTNIGTDWMYGSHKSMHGNTGGQVFGGGDSHFIDFYPGTSKSLAGEGLKSFIHDWGRPDTIVMDGANEQTGRNTEFQRTCRKEDIHVHVTEPYRPEQNPAEKMIGEAKKKWFRHVMKKRPHPRTWDYGFKWICKIMQRTAYDTPTLKNRTSIECM
jgi:transposase